MKKISLCLILIIPVILYSCSGTQKAYTPARKYSPESLREDFRLFRTILEKKHPSLYWYSTKDSIDRYFNLFESAITDSMTESAFAWRIIAPMTRQIRCGHTTVGMSKAYGRWAKGKQLSSFPLYMKIWNDSMVVTGNLNRKDSLLKRGTVITSINGIRNHTLIRNMFQYLPADGYAENINQVRLSANFPYFHRNIFGLSKVYRVGYIDSAGREQTVMVPLYEIKKDSTAKKVKTEKVKKIKKPRIPKTRRLEENRSLDIDTSGTYAVMTVNTFSGGMLRSFFRRSFRELGKRQIKSLIIDVRSNGGGHISLSTLLTRYISHSRFRVGDSVHAVARSLGPYSKHIRGQFINNMGMFLVARKKKDGRYHIPYMENKWHKPKKKNHYNGNVYVLTSGNTFSAAALFCNTVKGQEGITLVGEETGGSWHGNNGVLIPEIILPNTHVRVRLPLYRLVQFNHVPKNGSGIIPDIHIGPDYRALVERRDKKMESVKDMIRQAAHNVQP